MPREERQSLIGSKVEFAPKDTADSILGFSAASSEGGESLGMGQYGSRASKVSSINSVNMPITLSWENLNVYAMLEKPMCGKPKNQYGAVGDGRKQILHDVTGVIKPGQLVALMGASGAGKTTLLNTLTGRNVKGCEVDGSIRVNGDEIGRGITSISAYVQQDDLFIPTLTVREHLRFQALLRLPKELSRERKMRRADEVLFDLGLIKCANTRIGDPSVKRGVSGGEAKRLAFASEILTNPPLLFCDEPTTGLDSYMAESVVAVLQRLADRGKTILCTIHQPASEIYAMFNQFAFNLLLLAEGRTAFLGTTPEALGFFESGGIPCPLDYNPADFFIQTLAIMPGRETESRERVHGICDRYYDSEYRIRVEKDVVEGDRMDSTLNGVELVDLSNKSPYKSTWLVQFFALLWRSSANNWRNWTIAFYKILNKLILGIFMGLIYLDAGSGQAGIANKNGAIFFAMMEISFPAVFSVLNMLPQEYRVMVREHHDGVYKVSSYYVAKIVSLIPVYSSDGLLFLIISYYMVGLQPALENFLIAMGIIILTEQCATAFGTMMSCVSPNFTVALVIAGPFTTIVQMTGGYFGNVATLPPYLNWFQYLSWFRYGFEAFAVNEWSSVSNITCPDTLETGCMKNGAEVIASFSFTQANYPGFDIGMLFVLCFGYYFVGYLGLWLRTYKER